MIEEYSSAKIIRGFKENDEAIIKEVYNFCFGYISWFLPKNGGTFEDAKDIMQEAMLLFFRNCRTQNFKIENAATTHIINSAKFIWLNKRRKVSANRKNYSLDYLEAKGTYYEEMDDKAKLKEKEKEYDQKRKVYKSCFQELKEECKDLLTLALKYEETSEITKRMKFKDDASTIDKKRRCKQKLLELISNHPNYKKLKNE